MLDESETELLIERRGYLGRVRAGVGGNEGHCWLSGWFTPETDFPRITALIAEIKNIQSKGDDNGNERA